MGVSKSEFDSMTPREFCLYAEAYTQKLDAEQERKQHEIYVSALLTSRWVFAKHIPKYEEIFKKRQRDDSMSDEAMLATVRALNAQLGGEEVMLHGA